MSNEPRRLLSLAVKLLLASLVAGLALSYFGYSPRSLLDMAGVKVQDMFEKGGALIDQAWVYIIPGAIIVIPLWLLVKVAGWLRRRG